MYKILIHFHNTYSIQSLSTKFCNNYPLHKKQFKLNLLYYFHTINKVYKILHNSSQNL